MVNAKLFMKINKHKNDLSIYLAYVEQDVGKNLLKQWKILVSESLAFK